MIGDTTHDLQMARSAGVAARGGDLRRASARASCARLQPLACVITFAGTDRQWLTAERLICAASAARGGRQGRALRAVQRYGGDGSRRSSIRYRRRVHAYLNRCAHVPMELDWARASSSIRAGYTWCARRTARSTARHRALRRRPVQRRSAGAAAGRRDGRQGLSC